MARTKSTVSTTSTEKKVEAAETTTENQAVEVEETTEKAETKSKKDKVISDSDEVTIKCESLAGKKIVGLEGKVFEFDADGKSVVDGKNANRFLTIPGYTLA